MVAIFIRSDASTDHQIISTEFLRPVFDFGQKPILIIHHHSDPDPNFQNDTSQLKSSYARDLGIVHCKDDGETLPNGNSIFIHNFCRAFNSYDDFSGQVLIFHWPWSFRSKGLKLRVLMWENSGERTRPWMPIKNSQKMSWWIWWNKLSVKRYKLPLRALLQKNLFCEIKFPDVTYLFYKIFLKKSRIFDNWNVSYI